MYMWIGSLVVFTVCKQALQPGTTYSAILRYRFKKRDLNNIFAKTDKSPS